MKGKIFPLFTNIYIPYFTLSLAEKKHNRKDIILFYESSNNNDTNNLYVYSCSKSISFFGIKPGMPINFVKKLTNNFFLLPCSEFIEEKDFLKNLLLDKLKSYAFALYDIPSYTINQYLYDSLCLIADFSGCQLLYKPIFIFLESLFRSLTKIDKRILFSFFTSDSFSFSLYIPPAIELNFSKNLSFIFYNSRQFLDLIKFSNILSPLNFFEESGILYFSDLIRFPPTFQEKLLNLLIASAPLSSQIKLANRLKPLLLPFQSIKKHEPLDIFLSHLFKKLFSKDSNSLHEIVISFSLPTNNKIEIQSQIKKRLYLESYFLKTFWLKSKVKQISVAIEYTNQSIEHFELFFENIDILSFFNSISEDIVFKLKQKSAINSIVLKFDQTSYQQLFDDNFDSEDKRLLELFNNLIHKFGDEKIHLAG
ncbi:MAG TPA: hypothetical protein PLF21_01550 [Exilispira sp.]|nr:hypothetical protein [Exilispira sp.]